MVKTLANKIRFAYQNYDSIFIYVVGRIGAGKTSFALHLAREILGDWRKVLDHVYFDVNEFMKKCYNLVRRSERMKIVILDDAGATLNSLRFREEKMMKIAEILNLSRSFVSGLVFTTPDIYDVLRRVRVKAMFSVQITPVNTEKALARIYQTSYSVAYDKYYRKFVTEVEYPRKYPIFKQYQKKRMNYIRRRLKEIIGKKSSNSVSTVRLTHVLCPKCRNIGRLTFQITNNQIYLYVIHDEKEICWIGKLRENKELFVELIKKQPILIKT